MHDYTGSVHGCWTFKRLVPKEGGTNPKAARRWEVECECGTTKVVIPNDLFRTEETDCRCNRIIRKGRTFDYLTVNEVSERRGSNGGVYYKLICVCGKSVEAAKNDLLRGQPKSCGCKTKELQSESLGYTLVQRDLMSKWRSRHSGAMSRCYNSNSEKFANYGLRGIEVEECLRDLLTFSEFFESLWLESGKPAEFHIDRVDVNKGYTRDNLRLVSALESARNKQRTIYVRYKGELIPLAKAASLTGINYATLHERNRKGWGEPRLYMPDARFKPS